MRIGIEEATMAALTFRTTKAGRRSFGSNAVAALSACREWLDTFVSNRMRRAVAEVENVRPAGNASIELVRDDKQDL
jgi:hypothetical protein